MSHNFSDPPLDIHEIILVDRAAVEAAFFWISGCEVCTEDAAIPFDYVLDRVTGQDPEVTDYLMEAAVPCPCCGNEIVEKTLVSVHPKTR